MSRWICIPCNITFTSRRALKRHQDCSRTHLLNINADPDVSARHQCSRCNKTFVRLHDLRRHNSEQHGDGKKPCARCNKVIRSGAPHQDALGGDCCGREASSLVASAAHSSHERATRETLQIAFVDKSIRSTDGSVCNYCEISFKELDSQARLRHAETHLRELTTGWECEHCQIVFQRGHDLMLHFRCAERAAHCGFDFEHKLLCYGHHPPPATEDVRWLDRDQDRRRLCVRLRSWESEQLQRYRMRTATLPGQTTQDDPTNARDRTDHGQRDYESLEDDDTDKCIPDDAPNDANSKLQVRQRSLPLLKGLLSFSAWDGVENTWDFNEDHLFSHEWNSKDKDLYREFLLLMRNLIRLKVDGEHILNTLQATTHNPGLFRRLFEWKQIAVLSKSVGTNCMVDKVALFLLEGICRDLGCEWLPGEE